MMILSTLEEHGISAVQLSRRQMKYLVGLSQMRPSQTSQNLLTPLERGSWFAVLFQQKLGVWDRMAIADSSRKYCEPSACSVEELLICRCLHGRLSRNCLISH